MHRVGILSGIPADDPDWMAKRKSSVRLTDQARRVSETLSRRFNELANSQALPNSDVASEAAPETLSSLDAVTGIDDEEYRRLRLWLNELASQNDPLAYAALLQIWLNVHNIEWPEKVFAPGKDLTSRGRGSRAKKEKIDYSRARRLKSEGKKWPEIARELRLARSDAGAKSAGDRLRKLLGRGFLTESLDQDVIEHGLRMLGIPTEQDHQDFMREIVGPAYDSK